MPSFRVVIVPHTHWDREWYLPSSRFRQRLVTLLDDAVAQLESDPALTFHLDGQVSLIDDYLEVRSDMRSRVAALVGDGRLAIGPWYVLADELLAGDEPLVRNLLVGRKRAADFGGWLPVGYSPDAFGHPATLPAILTGFGIETAVLGRGCGDAAGQGAGDLFRWQAPDGSGVLVHRLPPAGYEYGAELPTRPQQWRRRWGQLREMLVPRATVPVLLVMNGADHHALQPDLAAAVAALKELAPEHDVEIGTLDTYFERARDALKRLPQSLVIATLRGELRYPSRDTWVLQGVHATRASLKRRIAEGATLLVRWAEPQAALAMASGGRDRRPQLGAAWRHHLLNLSHDALAGCVADEVAEDVAARARIVVQEARGLLDDALMERLGQDPVRARRERGAWVSALALVNPSPRPRAGVVETTVTLFLDDVVVGRSRQGRQAAEGPGAAPDISLRDRTGRLVPHQVLHAYRAYERLDSPRAYPDQDRVWALRVALFAPEIPALGLSRLEVGEIASRRGGSGAAPGLAVSGHRMGLTAPWGRVGVGRSGFEIRAGARSLAGAAQLVSERDEGDTYTFEPVPGDVPVAAEWEPARVVWRGPLVAALARGFAVPGRSRGRLSVRVDAGSSLIRFVVEGENLRGNHRLRIVFPVQAAARVTADMPYGPVTRRLSALDPAEFPWEWPAPAGPMHRFVSGGQWTILTRGLHEYELLQDGAIAVTLLRAVGELSRGGLRARSGHAAWPAPTPGAQESGPFRVELALAPMAAEEGSGGAAWVGVEAAAEEFHAPLAGRMLRHGLDVPDMVAGPALVGSGLAFKSLKPRDEGAGVVVRCVNLTDTERAGAWRWPSPVARAYRARLDETVLEELRLGAERRVLSFKAGPREIVTLMVET